MDRKLATDIESEGNWSDHVTVDHEYSEASLLAWKRGVRLKWDAIGYQGTVLY